VSWRTVYSNLMRQHIFKRAENRSKNTLITQLKEELEKRDRGMRQLENMVHKYELERAHANAHTQMQGAANQNKNMEVLVCELEADQIRYRAEVKAQLEELQRNHTQIEKLEKAKDELIAENKALREQLHPKLVGLDIEDKRTMQRAKYEVDSCVAELASLRQLVKQAQTTQGQDVGMDLNESILQNPSNSLLGSIGAIKQEAAALRTAFTTVYAESLGNNCAVQ